MHLKRKGIEAQLPEEYTRVTNPERLRPLHDVALQLFTHLAADYEVAESEAFEIIPGIMRHFAYARPPITLMPNSPDEAPISVAFTEFPGLILRCGRFFCSPFPICGCDNCRATVHGESERLRGILESVVTGHFVEEIELPIFGAAHARWRLGSIDKPYGLSQGEIPLSRDRARELRHAGHRRVRWKAWSNRLTGPTSST